jgi:hypothetical protein
MIACLLVPMALLKNWPVTWFTTSAWNAHKTGPKHTTVFCMTAHICCHTYQGAWDWFCSLASALGLAPSACCPPCQFPQGWDLVPGPVRGHSTSPYRRPLSSKRNSGFGALCEVRGRERVTFLILMLVALYLTKCSNRYVHPKNMTQMFEYVPVSRYPTSAQKLSGDRV